VELRSPDSFGLYLVIASIQDPPLSGEPVILHSSPTRSVQSFYWLPVDTLLCGTCDLITVYPTETTEYDATAIDSNGCTVTERIQVPVQPPVYAPNVVAPGVAGNDVFTLFAKESLLVEELLIYDRWGSLVFEGKNLLTNSLDQGWNGMINGRPGAPGVYFFQAMVQYLPGKTMRLMGDVTLLR
jgi:gliding motility-associated-like protein